MAIYPKKSKDPTEVALSAIQDALNVRDSDATPPIAATIATAAEASNESRKRPRVAPAGRDAPLDRLERSTPLDRNASIDALPPPQDDREIVRAANDDQESIGQLLQSLQRQPKSLSFAIATLLAAIWAISAIGLLINFGAPTLREGLHRIVNDLPPSASPREPFAGARTN